MEAGEQLEADAKYDGEVGKIKGGGKGKKVKKGGDDKVYNVVAQYVPDDLYERIKKNDTSNINEDIKTLTKVYVDHFSNSDTYPTARDFIDALFEGIQNHESEIHSEELNKMDKRIGGGLLKLLGLKKSKKSPKKKAAKKTKKAAKKATKKAAKKTKKVAKKAKKAPKKAAKKNFDDDISKWDVSNVTTIKWYVGNATSFNQPIGAWDTHNVTNMYGMFQMRHPSTSQLVHGILIM